MQRPLQLLWGFASPVSGVVTLRSRSHSPCRGPLVTKFPALGGSRGCMSCRREVRGGSLRRTPPIKDECHR